MKPSSSPASEGGVTSPLGFQAGAAAAGIRDPASDRLDVGLLYSEVPCAAAALFTTNRVQAAPIVLTRQRLTKGEARAVVVNAGCANASTGARGLADAEAMGRLAARRLGIPEEQVLVASTGVIGRYLPLERIGRAVESMTLSHQGGEAFARAIMTTDLVPKSAVVALEYGGSRYLIGGCAKGSGMIHPDLSLAANPAGRTEATMLAFLTTDAAVEPAFLRDSLRRAADVSFNCLTVDGDTNPNDMVLFLANGAAGGTRLIDAGHPAAEAFLTALTSLCQHLTRALARDAEGATRLLEVTVEGAADDEQARLLARTIARSLLVKAAVHGCDPNWGRVLTAAGYSGVELREDLCTLWIQGVCLFQRGEPVPFDEAALRAAMDASEVRIRLDLDLGRGRATAWGSDLTEEYVRINAEYTT